MELPTAKSIGIAILSLALPLASGCGPRTEAVRQAEAAGLEASPLAGGGADIVFTLAAPGKVSLAVYNDEGRLLRTLLSARPLTAGRHAMHWDGLDRDGQAAAPGDYSARLLQTGGLRSEPVANVGVNPKPFWEVGVGNHVPAAAVAVDDEGMTLVPSIVEGGFTIARILPDRSYAWAGVGTHSAMFDFFRLGGTRRIRHSHHWGFLPCAATTDGETVLVLRNDGILHRVDRQSGAVAGPPIPMHWPEKPEGKDAGGVNVGLGYLNLDAHDGIAVISYRRYDALRWYDLATGKVLHEVTDIPAPTGVAMIEPGAALVISRGAIWRVQSDGRREVFVPEGELVAPWRLSADRERNELLVAENCSLAGPVDGQRHAVKRFDKDGALLAVYGCPEGRQDGVYNASDFRHISAIAATADGGFVVAEPYAPPLRVARFNREGEVVMEFFGSVPYATSATPEPGNPRRVWYSTGSGLVRAAVDYETNGWQVLETYSETIRPNPLVEVSSHMSKGLKTFSVEGRLYVATLGGTLFLYDPEAPSLRPVFAEGLAATDTQRNRNPESHGWFLPPDLRHPERPPHNIRTGYFWSDLDGDGLATRDELSFYNGWQAGGPSGFVAFYRDDLTMVRTSGQIYLPARITEDGVPVYDPTQPSEILPFGGGSHLYHAAAGHWYRSYRAPLRGERHGIWWWPGLSGTGRLVKYDTDFKPIWSVGCHTATWDGEPGWQHGFEGIAGEVHDCIVVDGNFVDTESVGPMAYTRDGLFVDALLIHSGGNFPEWVYYGSRHENPRGTVMRDPQTGDVLFFAHGNSSAPIFRIDGWDGWRRAETTFALDASAPHASGDGTGLQADYFDNAEWIGTPVVSRIDERMYFDWEKTTTDENVPQRGFSARWTGVVEAPLSETFLLVLRTGTNHRSLADSPLVRLWVNGEKVVDSSAMLGYEPRNYERGYWRALVPMLADGRQRENPARHWKATA